MVLAAGTAANIFLLWRFSIVKHRPHGIYRFFSFESIIILVFICAPVWSTAPSGWQQIASWILLVGSIPLPVIGFYQLHVFGKPKGDIENTSMLVTTGVYRFVRHPLYLSLALLGTGIFLKHIEFRTFVFALVNLAVIIATARVEEKEMVEKFGDDYLNYIKHTKMFVPFLY